MEKIICFIENVTGEQNLSSKTWQEIVDEVILPRMAGTRASRCSIGDMFLNFLAYFPSEISVKDLDLAPVLFEIGLQRLSCGAVIHDEIPWLETLPKEYQQYSSSWDFNHTMTQGCYNFIMNGLEIALKLKTTRDHALKILFGLMQYITPTGEVDSNYVLGDFTDRAEKLFHHAEKLVETYASFEEIYPYYVCPVQWEKHLSYLGKNKDKLNWDDFFEKTKTVKKGNFISMRIHKNVIRKRIENAAV